jgi:uncharacterized membrane protein
MLEIIAKILGIIGLLLITYGIFAKKRIVQDEIFAIGGIFLLTYSVSLRDLVFITLQIVFTISSVYEVYKLKKEKWYSFLKS